MENVKTSFEIIIYIYFFFLLTVLEAYRMVNSYASTGFVPIAKILLNIASSRANILSGEAIQSVSSEKPSLRPTERTARAF